MMSRSFPYRPALVIALLAGGGAMLSMWAAYRVVEASALDQETQQLQRQLELHSQAIQQRIDRYRTLPQILALDEELRAALLVPMDAEQRDRLNRRLEGANSVTRASTLTLIDRNGVALAASNWREPTSNVGENYSFRPYFKQAMESGEGQFYGIGLTTGAPGYFMSEAIIDAEGHAAGVVVIKIELGALESEWLSSPDIVMVSDAYGVVFLSNREAWRYRTLTPLSDRNRAELASTRQYARQLLMPIDVQTIESLNGLTRMAQFRQPELTHDVLWQTAVLPEKDWTLHLLHDASPIESTAATAALAAGGGWLALSFLSLFVHQRRRLSKLRQRSREELETVLRQHAQELRTAQDVIVETARKADSGLSSSLEHLPQGVVIIDAELRLVAWNTRYVELFRFPAEMLQVGRPIEALFRYNAQRGLLGPGPLEDAIERRLNHLRSGRPHMRESEKEDGTVLEIRGNPLPDGGFVTSYADITTYKNAARELRSLADALEQRVQDRTRALAAAKLEAESANRYKTRFVAAAVHDLLQPLNAARMFLSGLRGHLSDADHQRIADHVGQALRSQDAILNSLLDISRLESGAQATRVRDFALDPLLAALAREFGILAEDRGLVLQYLPTRVIVRSDEALLRRILQNFLSNAIRYTPRGRLLLGCRRTPSGVRIEVHDQGPGIPDSLQTEIFEEFRRLNDGVVSDRGAGLGLAIVERIGRLLSHPIRVRSQLGVGSVFSVEVPLGQRVVSEATLALAHGAPNNDSSLLECRVWCVGHQATEMDALHALLTGWGCAVNASLKGDRAEDIACPVECPDMLLLDLGPGLAEAGALYSRCCAQWGKAPPIILLSNERGDAESARERAWGFLLKPVRPSALRGLMTQLLLRHAEAPR